uniref:Uncharacterized protein n=1 Tax=Oryza punctata TaxID=4537 RepID=A0A0E0K3L6_ORYPU
MAEAIENAERNKRLTCCQKSEEESNVHGPTPRHLRARPPQASVQPSHPLSFRYYLCAQVTGRPDDGDGEPSHA